jgi:hypothetical protein
MTVQSGPQAARVSRFRALDSGKAMPTNDTSGPLFTALSPSAALQRSLESRLRALMDLNGAPEYVLIWKTGDMPAGLPICRLRASARRTSDSALHGWPTPNTPSGGPNAKSTPKHTGGMDLEGAASLASWPTPTAVENSGDPEKKEARRQKAKAKWGSKTGNGFGFSLAEVSEMAVWPTPMADNAGTETYNPAGNTDSNRKTVELVTGWATPTARDWKSEQATDNFNYKRWKHPRGKPLGAEALLSPALTENGAASQPTKRASLNPGFSLWLMLGPFATAWLSAAEAVTRSTRGSSRASSKRARKPSQQPD